MANKLYLLVGPSGAGKTTLAKELKGLGLRELISHTTRKPRPDEINGVDYYFVNDIEFGQTEMVESNAYPSENGNFHYGISLKEMNQKLGHGPAFAIVERNGATLLKKEFPSLVKIVFLSISKETAIKRLVERGESIENTATRITKAVEDDEFTPHPWTNYTIRECSVKESTDAMKRIIHSEEKIDYLRVVGR